MNTRLEEIAAEAMTLSPRDQVKLAQRLVSSLGDQFEADVEELWLAEAERRIQELRTDAVKGIDAAEAFKKARETFKR